MVQLKFRNSKYFVAIILLWPKYCVPNMRGARTLLWLPFNNKNESSFGHLKIHSHIFKCESSLLKLHSVYMASAFSGILLLRTRCRVSFSLHHRCTQIVSSCLWSTQWDLLSMQPVLTKLLFLQLTYGCDWPLLNGFSLWLCSIVWCPIVQQIG